MFPAIASAYGSEPIVRQIYSFTSFRTQVVFVCTIRSEGGARILRIALYGVDLGSKSRAPTCLIHLVGTSRVSQVGWMRPISRDTPRDRFPHHNSSIDPNRVALVIEESR